ncbi:hypothetical protein NGR_c35230 [Sinorhizobium fredii NGR234]|uniref:Uncharacterized protein n=1 Tax=Sinorhizobium fredii (strain NBRC 101917 / NGR234) TaxID=394 RepID=C3MC22_SINFN|nr:hypothetical protein NGR_c35230 [Sinorhizobium fredii NGR234]
MRVQEQLDEQRFQRLPVVSDLVIARRLAETAVLQPVQGGFAGKHRTVLPLRRQPLRQKREHRVVAQPVVVIDILVAQRDRRNALPDQRAHAVDRARRIAVINEASGHPVEQSDDPIDMAKQQGAGIRGDRSAVETSDHFVTVEAFKFELLGDTVCLHRTPSTNLITLCSKRSFSDSRARCTSYFEIFRLALSARGERGRRWHTTYPGTFFLSAVRNGERA